MAQQQEPASGDSILRKLGRIGSYLRGDYPFVTDKFDYEGYWEQLSHRDASLVSSYKQRLMAHIIEEGSSVLDIGCGDGTLLHYLKETKRVQVAGIELSGVAVQQARAKGLPVEQADLTHADLRRGEVYDYIILSEVIEHLPRPQDLLLSLRDRFRKNIIVTIPNSAFLGERLRLALGRFPKQWVYHPSEHLRFWSVPDFHFWCQQLGYRLERFYGLKDEYYDVRLPLWRWYPRLFARYILYQLARK